MVPSWVNSCGVWATPFLSHRALTRRSCFRAMPVFCPLRLGVNPSWMRIVWAARHGVRCWFLPFGGFGMQVLWMGTCFPSKTPSAPGEPQGNLFLRTGAIALCSGRETEAWCKAELGSLIQGHAQASVTIPGLACVGKDVLAFGWGNAQGTSITRLGSPPCAVSGCRRLSCTRRLAQGVGALP